MLTLSDSAGRLGRRDFLRVGSLGTLALPQLAHAGATAAAVASGRPVTDKAVVFLFLHGGPSQFETFDPKMNSAPAEMRSVTGEIPTAVPGVTFGSSFPGLAKRADRLCVVRSFVPGDSKHDIKTVVGPDTLGANPGAAYSHAAGGTHPTTGLPTNVLLFPPAVDPLAQPGTMKFGRFDATGPFGTATAPFQPGGGGGLQSDMRVSLPMDRLDDRRALLAGLDRAALAADGADELDAARRKALTVLLHGAGDAFDLKKEDPKTVARYDTAGKVNIAAISKKWNNHKNYADNARSLGRLLLLARRLCERGAGFVTVTTNFVWDMHADNNNAPVGEGMSYMAPPLDHAVSVFLDDLRERGLEDKILLVACGEMGRTPRLNKGGGRDHWGNLGPLLLAGGGLPGGRVIGRSTANGGDPATDPVRITNLMGTITRTLLDGGKLRATRGVSRELLQLVDYAPIPGLHG